MYVSMESESSFEGQRVRGAQSLSVSGLYDSFSACYTLQELGREGLYI